MRRTQSPSKDVLAKEEKLLPAEIANINASVNWDRIWLELGSKIRATLKGTAAGLRAAKIFRQTVLQSV